MATVGGTIVTIAIAYGALVGCAYLFQNSLIYHPSGGNGPFRPADFGVPEMRVVELETKDGLRLVSWYAPAQRGHPTLAYFHGNGGHFGWRGSKVRPYLDAGLGVFLLSYRGYGGNPGRPSESGLYADARAVIAFLAREGVAERDLVLYGESLGTAVAVEMARGRALGALVLEAPMTSAVDVGQSTLWFLPVRLLAREEYDSASKIKEIRAPVLMFHGSRDRIIDAKFGRTLFGLAPEPKEFRDFPAAGHNDLYDHGAPDAALGFLRRNLDF